MTTKRSLGFSVRIFIPSGEPDGLRLVEKSNWNGQGLLFPRSLFSEARQRNELKRTGIYVLWGPSESGELPRVYVGEGDPVLPRIEQHMKNKDFWVNAVAFTSKDQNLNKAHVQYLEARLITLASEAKRCELDNFNNPQLPALSEADTADAEAFLSDVLLCLPVLGVRFFEKPKAPVSERADLFLKAKGVEARGIDAPEGFVVRAGSTAVKKEVPSIHGYLRELRRTLVENGVFKDGGNVYKLTQDYTFSSPFTAAGVLLGRAANGRTEWKSRNDQTLKEIQEKELEALENKAI